jgi:hypothetical protein
MSNGDYNFPFQPAHYPNDRKQARLTIIGAVIAAIVIVVLIVLAIQ